MNATSKEVSDNAALAAYLDDRSAKSRRHAKKNDSYTTACYFVAIFSSFLAASATPIGIPSNYAPLIAGIPALALLLNSVFAFEKKSIWHRQRRLAYRALWMRIVYESEDIATVSKAMREFEEGVATDSRVSG